MSKPSPPSARVGSVDRIPIHSALLAQMSQGPKPPPPPPSAGGSKVPPPPTRASPRPPRASSAPPVPSKTKDRMQLAAEAMRLRDEQLRAHVVYVDPQIETNAELDAITAKVVEELKELQRVGMRAKVPEDPGQLEIELIAALRQLLEKMVSARREHFLRHKMELIQRRVAKLFFEQGCVVICTFVSPFSLR